MSNRIEYWDPRSGQLVRRGVDIITPPPPPPPPPSKGAYPGDPGPNNYYIGWAMKDGSTPPSGWDVNQVVNNPGFPGYAKVSVIHDYSGGLRTRVDDAKLDAGIGKGCIPSQSFKLSGWTVQQVESGAADADIDYSAGLCAARAPRPIWLCYKHEPENDVTTAADMLSYRNGYRRIVTRFRAAGVTNVAWMPIYMNPFTFWGSMSPTKGGSTRNWLNWHADWNSATGTWYNDIMMDMMGMDTYSPISTATQKLQFFDQMFNDARSVIEKPGNPTWDYVIPEFGLSNDNANNPVDWGPWGATAHSYMVANRIKSICYWDNSTVPIGRYGFGPSYDPNGTKLVGWNHIVNGTGSTKYPGP